MNEIVHKPLANFEVEMMVLRTLMTDSKSPAFVRCWDDISGLEPKHFADKRHGAIFDVQRRLNIDGRIGDPMVLVDHFEQTGEIESIGGTKFIADLAACVPMPMCMKSYRETLIDYWRRREAVELAKRLEDGMADRTIDARPDMVAAGVMAELDAIMAGASRHGPESISTAVEGALQHAEAAYRAGGGVIGLRTGLAELDNMLGGLRNQNLIILGARPSMGKTTLAANIARNIARAEKTVAWFSLEMSKEECASLALSAETGIGSNDILRGKLESRDFSRLVEAQGRLMKDKILIDDSAGLYVAEMESRARTLKPDFVIVDHLGLSAGDVPGDQYRSRYEKVSAVSNALKRMAKRLSVPVIALTQLSRAIESRAFEERRPQLSDLRDSGDIEQDADVVLFLFRTAYYLERIPAPARQPDWGDKMRDSENITEIIVAKQRMGPTGMVEVFFDPARGIFTGKQHDDRG